eukprot:TRINITY_DN16322_c0_g1_i1.p1 TRINITY_DN16322_c0_g1~~TRINITY_DN16322_c0_g1_i1.p1  ORF type:complete len:709 (+),score=116.45 TRINITY_DN16322_c0_g1_i1:81-2207(+)
MTARQRPLCTLCRRELRLCKASPCGLHSRNKAQSTSHPMTPLVAIPPSPSTTPTTAHSARTTPTPAKIPRTTSLKSPLTAPTPITSSRLFSERVKYGGSPTSKPSSAWATIPVEEKEISNLNVYDIDSIYAQLAVEEPDIIDEKTGKSQMYFIQILNSSYNIVSKSYYVTVTGYDKYGMIVDLTVDIPTTKPFTPPSASSFDVSSPPFYPASHPLHSPLVSSHSQPAVTPSSEPSNAVSPSSASHSPRTNSPSSSPTRSSSPSPPSSPSSTPIVLHHLRILWVDFPWEVSSWSLETRISHSQTRVPCGSVFKVKVIGLTEKWIRIIPAKYAKPELNLSASFFPLGTPKCRWRYLVALDLEATCDYCPNPKVTTQTAEIIEFPWIVIDTHTLKILDEQQIYVRPDNLEGVTKYATKLTGISKDMVKQKGNLSDTIKLFDEYIKKKFGGSKEFCIITDGIWDLQVQLHMEAQKKGIPLAWYFREYLDLKEEFRNFLPWFPQSYKPDLSSMLKALRLDFIGKPHQGIDDSRNIAQIVMRLILLGHTFSTPKKILPDYNPYTDPNFVDFGSQTEMNSWQCSSKQCGLWNRPWSQKCKFCSTSKDEKFPADNFYHKKYHYYDRNDTYLVGNDSNSNYSRSDDYDHWEGRGRYNNSWNNAYSTNKYYNDNQVSTSGNGPGGNANGRWGTKRAVGTTYFVRKKYNANTEFQRKCN